MLVIFNVFVCTNFLPNLVIFNVFVCTNFLPNHFTLSVRVFEIRELFETYVHVYLLLDTKLGYFCSEES